MEHIIDCDADPTPFVFDEFELFKHDKAGKVKWNPDDYELYPLEITDGWAKGHNWFGARRKHDKKDLNANFLDFLLEHPELIPED